MKTHALKLTALCLTAIALLGTGCQRPPSTPHPQTGLYKKSSLIMHTLISITVAAEDEAGAEKAIDSAFAEIKRLEVMLSFWTQDSEIAQINAMAGKSEVKVSDETYAVIDRAMYISRMTQGAFDPTIGPVIKLWNFWEKTMPSRSDLAQAVKLVDYTAMALSNSPSPTAYLSNPHMSFDTGGIAKGLAADSAVRILRDHGIKAALVSVAGDIRAYGSKPDGSPWTVGIRDPRGERQDLMAQLALENEAISTSGDYERFFIAGGIRYHHILAPDTGMPAQGCMSVSVIAPEAVLTDGLSTGIFVMGPDKGLALLKEMHLEGLIIDSSGLAHATDGMKERLKWLTDKYQPAAVRPDRAG